MQGTKKYQNKRKKKLINYQKQKNQRTFSAVTFPDGTCM